jgi:CPA1 family monovalent cation:H+ antiporter
VVGFASVLLMKYIKDVQAETTLTFIIAFTSYIVAEHFGFSGVISTVTAGIYFGLRFPEFAPTKTRMNARAIWRTLIFIINGFIFTLLGLQLPSVLKNLGSYSIVSLIFYGVMISVAVMLLRIIWIFPSVHFPRLLFPAFARRDPAPPWQLLLIFGWTGMRGIITLAAVLAIPHTLPSGLPFPHRDLLVFLAYCVIVSTLLIPAFTLPFLIPFLRISDEQEKIREEAAARMRVIEGVLQRIKDVAAQEHIPKDVYEEFIGQIEQKHKVIKSQLYEMPYSLLTQEFVARKRLLIAALESERETLIMLRKSGQIHEEVFHLLVEELDIEEIRARSLRL